VCRGLVFPDEDDEPTAEPEDDGEIRPERSVTAPDFCAPVPDSAPAYMRKVIHSDLTYDQVCAEPCVQELIEKVLRLADAGCLWILTDRILTVLGADKLGGDADEDADALYDVILLGPSLAYATATQALLVARLLNLCSCADEPDFPPLEEVDALLPDQPEILPGRRLDGRRREHRNERFAALKRPAELSCPVLGGCCGALLAEEHVRAAAVARRMEALMWLPLSNIHTKKTFFVFFHV